MLVLGLNAFGLSTGLGPAGNEVRVGFGRGFAGFGGCLPATCDGGDPSTLAAAAAVRAVAAAGRRTGRVGDLGRGLLNGCLGEVLSGLLTGLATELPDDGAGFEGFDDGPGAGLDAAEVLCIGFLLSLANSFGSLAGADFGEASLGVDCLPDAVAIFGVRGPGSICCRGSRCVVSLVLEATIGVAGCVSGTPSGLLSVASGVCEDSGGESNFGAARGAAGALDGAAFALGGGAGFGDCVSFGFPLTLEFTGALVCFLGDLGGATVAVAFEDPEGLAFFAFSFSNGEPFNMGPSPVVSSPRVAPPPTAA